MSLLTISNENIFFKTQGTRLGAVVTPNKGLDLVLWCIFSQQKTFCLRLNKRMCINVKLLGCVCLMCQQVAILLNIVSMSSRKAEVQIHRWSTSWLTAVYSWHVKKYGFKSTTRIHPFDNFVLFSLEKPFDVLFSSNCDFNILITLYIFD